MSVFGMDFQVLHLFAAHWCIAAIWLIRVYYAADIYASAGLLMPALLPFAGIFQEQTLFILSDAVFLAWSFVALLLWRRFLHSGHVGVLALEEFVHQNSDPDAVIAVTDWGVLPLSLERKTVSVLNDKDRIGSLRRIVDDGATHFVILEGTSARVEPAQQMVTELPQVFLPELLVQPKGPGAGGGRLSHQSGTSQIRVCKTHLPLTRIAAISCQKQPGARSG